MNQILKKAIVLFITFTITVAFMPAFYDADLVLATEDNSPSSNVYATKEELRGRKRTE